MKIISILGSTGSIGTQTLEIVREHSDKLRVKAIAAGKSVALLEKQIREFLPEYAVLWEEKDALDLQTRIKDLNTKVLFGMEGLITISTLPEVSVVVTALVGMIGIRPTIAALEAGKDIALANKETLVTAGHIIMPLAKKNLCSILPVDSEHSAIFQCLNGENPKEIEKIILTASGGPFRGKTKMELEHVTLEDALKHPNWSMGKKITIDSATMVNKGLEVMEAGWLFDVTPEQVQVVVHPQSIVHSMIEFKDKAVMAQLGVPDMKLPIQYALFYPNRLEMKGNQLDFMKLQELTFQIPDQDVFSALRLAYQAFRKGGNLPTILNAANECAVALFLERKIGFLEISQVIESAMDKIEWIDKPNLEQILDTEKACYEAIESRWNRG